MKQWHTAAKHCQQQIFKDSTVHIISTAVTKDVVLQRNRELNWN